MSLFGGQKAKTKLTALVFLDTVLRKDAFSDHVQEARKRYNSLARWTMKNGRRSLIGLGFLSVPSADVIVNESTQFFKEYLLQRLGQAKLLSPRMDYLSTNIVNEKDQKSKTYQTISTEIQNAASELESMHPELYGSVVQQLSQVLNSEAQVRRILLALAGHLYKGNLTWGKVIAGFSLAGAMACDCVDQERPEFVKQVVDTFTKITRDYTADWIVKQGGWVDLTLACRHNGDMPLLWAFSILGATIGFCLTIMSTLTV